MPRRSHRATGFRSVLGRFLFLGAVLHGLAIPAAAGEEQVIRFWNYFISGTPKESVAELVSRFNRENEGRWRVEMLDVPLMEQKIITATAGKVAPDIALFDRFRIAAFAERGTFRDIRAELPALGRGESDFFPPCIQECQYKDGLYGVPFNTDVRVLFYNRALFREAGLDPDRPPRTWEELVDTSKKLTRRDAEGRLQRIGFAPIYGNSWLYLYGWQNGGEFVSPDGETVTFTDPKIVEALQWMTDVCADYGPQNLLRFQTGFGVEAFYPFLSGKFGMDCQEGYLLGLIRRYHPELDFGVAPMPWPENGKHVTWSGGFALVFPVDSICHEGALEFARFLLSQESQSYFGQRSEQIPALISAAHGDYFMKDPYWRVFIDEMNYSRFRPVSPIGDLMFDQLARAQDFAVNQKLPPGAALEEAQKQCQGEYNRLRSKLTHPLVNWRVVAGIALLAALAILAVQVRRFVSHFRRTRLHRKEMLSGVLFASPAFIGLSVFVVGPMVASAVLSFCNYEVLSPARWAGGANFRRLLTEDPLFVKSLFNTFYYTALSVPLGVGAALGLALLLNRPFAGRSIFRTLFFIPSIIPLVAASVLWVWLYNGEYGLVNHCLQKVGLPGFNWLTNERLAKPAIVVMGLWGVGGGMMICLAGLQGIPRHLYEAAEIDGAGAWNRFLHVTLPCLSPTLFFLTIMGVIGSLQVFAQAYIMTDGGPLDSTLFYVFYLYRQGFNYFNMGYASAMAWLLVVVIGIASWVQFRLSRKWVTYGEE